MPTLRMNVIIVKNMCLQLIHICIYWTMPGEKDDPSWGA